MGWWSSFSTWHSNHTDCWEEKSSTCLRRWYSGSYDCLGNLVCVPSGVHQVILSWMSQCQVGITPPWMSKYTIQGYSWIHLGRPGWIQLLGMTSPASFGLSVMNILNRDNPTTIARKSAPFQLDYCNKPSGVCVCPWRKYRCCSKLKKKHAGPCLGTSCWTTYQFWKSCPSCQYVPAYLIECLSSYIPVSSWRHKMAYSAVASKLQVFFPLWI